LYDLICFRRSRVSPGRKRAIFGTENQILARFDSTTLADYLKTGKPRCGSVGRMLQGVDGRIVDPETGIPLSYGVEGVLEVRASNLGDRVNWLQTTDLTRMDEEQYLRSLGRADNAIVRDRFKNIPDNVVRTMEAHPAVRETSVVALAASRLGQVPAAVCIQRSDEEASEA
jgi:long-chain acyl-CoA synthetase